VVVDTRPNACRSSSVRRTVVVDLCVFPVFIDTPLVLPLGGPLVQR
jgi:hypothetical protein